MSEWITDRRPTEADGDCDGDVRICTSPRLNLEDFVYEKWNIVTPGWPWRHSSYCARTPVAPEPTPAAPKPEPEPEVWITDRIPTKADADCNGAVLIEGPTIPWSCLWHEVRPGKSWKHTELFQQKPEPEPPATVAIPRRFVSVRRTILKDGDYILDAIDDQGTAWWRRLDTSPHHPAFPAPEPEWQLLSPLPSHEVPAR